MKRHWLAGLIVLLIAASSALAQDKPTKPDKATKATPKAGAKNQPAVRPDAIPGYTIQTIEGFTVILSDETMKHQESSKDKRKPLEVLDLELKTVSSYLSNEAVNALRDLLIWVEWDEELAMANGRRGSAEAVYYGGHQLQMLEKGMHPLKAKNITILSMKALTAEHQPDRDAGRCVILHEMTHAVHDQFLGFDNPMVIAAYKQALERKLYDPQMYAATNEHEFFAELTCAYFDQLHDYPRTRVDLEKHDPITFQMLAGIWGQGKKVASKSKPDASGSQELKFKLDDIKLGKPLLGPTITVKELEGRVSILVFWNEGSLSSMAAFQKLNAWDAELSDFGLTSVAIHLTAGKDQKPREAAESRNVSFAVTEDRWTADTLVNDFNDFPVCLVFDQKGRCVFHGAPFNAESAVRSAVGSALVESSGVETFPKAMASQVESLTKGKSPALVLPQLIGHTRSSDDETSEAAKKLVAALVAGGQKVLDEAEPLAKSDPVGADFKIERLPLVFKGTPIAAVATKTLGKLKREKEVVAELRARPTLIAVRNIDNELSSQSGSFDPKQPDFQRENSALLEQLRSAATLMKKSWPDARGTKEARLTAARYGLILP